MCRKVNYITLNLWLATRLGGLLFASVFALGPSSVGAQTSSPYDVSGRWEIHQSNNTKVTVELRQNGTEISGTASYPAGRRGIERGTVTGTFVRTVHAWLGPRDDFNVEISWSYGIGVYIGDVNAGGFLGGSTYQKNKPSVKADWSSWPYKLPKRR